MKNIIRIIATSVLLIGANAAQAVVVVADLQDATNGGGFFGRVTFTDLAPGQVQIVADISQPINAAITQGDILGLWFDFAALPTSGIGAAGIIAGVYNPDTVSNSLGGNVNLNGSGPAGWDLGLQVGINGAAGGFNQMVTVTLTAMGLSANTFLNQRIGMRVQSIAGVPGFGAGSSKLLLTNGTPPPPQPIPEPGPLGLMLLGLGLMGGVLRRRRIG